MDQKLCGLSVVGGLERFGLAKPTLLLDEMPGHRFQHLRDFGIACRQDGAVTIPGHDLEVVHRLFGGTFDLRCQEIHHDDRRVDVAEIGADQGPTLHVGRPPVGGRPVAEVEEFRIETGEVLRLGRCQIVIRDLLELDSGRHRNLARDDR
jgi:hypothetical protein